MKNIIKKILELNLRFFAKAILNKYQPKIVAVTGSVGKTSTVEAIYTILAPEFKVRKNLKNYNNEIGIPLSIIGVESGNSSIIKWFAIFLKATGLILKRDKNYPRILILEMGADHPGDLEYLTKFIPIDVGVVTSVAPVHLEFFKTIDTVAQEKGTIIRTLTKNGTAILNSDDKLVSQMAKDTKAEVITFGLLDQAEVQGKATMISQTTGEIKGISFKLQYQGKTIPVLLPKVLAEHIVYSALAAIAVGLTCEISLPNIIKSLQNFAPPRGRMNLIKGIKNTLIIDDSYNSSPLAAKLALRQLSKIKAQGRKFAVLGDMLELGSYTEQGHQEVGEAAVEYKVDYLITVGEMSRDIIRGAIKKGLGKNNCFNFKNSLEAGKFLQQKIGAGDIILIKGSQGVRMEQVVKEIMAEPEKAKELLVRQDKSWRDKDHK